MSGNEPDAVVALAADPDGVLRRLIAAIDVVVRADLPRHALVGGIAVMANLAQAHRVTADVDTVSDDDHDGISHTVALLVDHQHAHAKPAGDGVILGDGTKVDIIATGAWAPADLPDDPIKRMFILSHWWAVETARTTTLVVIDGSTTLAAATVAIAQPHTLVAAKLQSMRTRRGRALPRPSAMSTTPTVCSPPTTGTARSPTNWPARRWTSEPGAPTLSPRRSSQGPCRGPDGSTRHSQPPP